MQARSVSVQVLSKLVNRLKSQLEDLPTASQLSERDAQLLYSLAYSQYGQGHYEQALAYFQLLLIYRPSNGVYLLGAALCLRRLKKYEHALIAFSALHLLEPTNPSHALALAESQLLCGQREPAQEMLLIVLDLCALDGSFRNIGSRARAMLDLMRTTSNESAPA